jgi:hypothetical protein
MTRSHPVTSASPEAASALPAIDRDQIATVVGGGADDANPNVCTPDNPTGERQPTQFFENSRSGPSVSDQVNKVYDDVMKPWQTFNGIFGGARGQRPQGPGPWKPEIR